MEKQATVYNDIARRTDSSVYLGVVGPVRTGKSTFIKRFMETMVIPQIESESQRERAIDELPQSASGKTIMTTEPKFVPENPVTIKVDDSAQFDVRLIDCVGYVVPSSVGYFEENEPRMVTTPWFSEEIPFNMAAEIGTKKVINEHSTIGVVVTTDGSISDIPREEYQEAEERIINELEEIGKPYVVILNCMYPQSAGAKQLREELEAKYEVPVVALSCLDMDEDEITNVMGKALYQFPVKEVCVQMPRWLLTLDKDHWLKNSVYKSITESVQDIEKMSDIKPAVGNLCCNEYITNSSLQGIDMGQGAANLTLNVKDDLFYKVLGENTGLQISDEEGLMDCIVELAKIKKEYDKIKGAIEEVNATGYGIVMPSLEELTLEEPEIVKQGGKYGVRLKASAPSIHMMRADITTEVAPIVGSEKQSEELVMYLLQDFEENPHKIWESNIFGKSLHALVNEGLHNKLYRMPSDARVRLQETIERIINEGCNGLICIIF